MSESVKIIIIVITGFIILGIFCGLIASMVDSIKSTKDRREARKQIKRKENHIKSEYEKWEDQFELIQDNSIENYRRLAKMPTNIDGPVNNLKEKYKKNIQNLMFTFLNEYAPSKEQQIQKKMDTKIALTYNWESKEWVKDVINGFCKDVSYESIMREPYTIEALDTFLEKGVLCNFFTEYQAERYRVDGMCRIINPEYQRILEKELEDNAYFITRKFKYLDSFLSELLKNRIINESREAEMKEYAYQELTKKRKANLAEKLKLHDLVLKNEKMYLIPRTAMADYKEEEANEIGNRVANTFCLLKPVGTQENNNNRVYRIYKIDSPKEDFYIDTSDLIDKKENCSICPKDHKHEDSTKVVLENPLAIKEPLYFIDGFEDGLCLKCYDKIKPLDSKWYININGKREKRQPQLSVPTDPIEYDEEVSKSDNFQYGRFTELKHPSLKNGEILLRFDLCRVTGIDIPTIKKYPDDFIAQFEVKSLEDIESMISNETKFQEHLESIMSD